MELKKLNRVVIKEELVQLTGDFKLAIILNQMIYWSERVKDFDKFIAEEKQRYEREDKASDLELQNGWIYKKAEELAEETLLGISSSNMRAQIKKLIDAGFICERTNPKFKWDRTKQYRVDLMKIQTELIKIGYSLEGHSLSGLISSSYKTENATIQNEKSNDIKQNIEPNKTENQTIQNRRAIPETTTETITKTTTHTNKNSEEVVCLLDNHVTCDEADKIFAISNNNMQIISEKYDVAKKMGYRNLVGFMIKAIREDWKMPKEQLNLEGVKSLKVKTKFHNFESRTSKYSPDELEKMVLKR